MCDFRDWHRHPTYRTAFARLLRDLKASAGAWNKRHVTAQSQQAPWKAEKSDCTAAESSKSKRADPQCRNRISRRPGRWGGGGPAGRRSAAAALRSRARARELATHAFEVLSQAVAAAHLL